MQSYTYNLTRTILYVGVGSLPLLSDQRVVLSNAAAWQPVPYTVTCQLSELRAAGVARPSGSVILRAILIPIIIPVLILISTWSRVNSASCARQGWRGRACNWIWTRAWIWMFELQLRTSVVFELSVRTFDKVLLTSHIFRCRTYLRTSDIYSVIFAHLISDVRR